MVKIFLKKVILTTLFIGILLFNIPVYATTDTPIVNDEEATINEGSNTGIQPDSALYILDRLFEDIQLSLTFDDINHSALLASITEERLQEIDYLMTKTSTEEVNQEEWDKLLENVISDYKEKLNEAIDSIEEIAIEIDEEEKAELDKLIIKIENSTNIDDNLIEDNEEAKEIIDRAIIVSNVAKNIDQEKAQELRDEGLGLGEISQIFALAETAEKDIDEITELYVNQNLGYKETAELLGLNVSDLAKQQNENKKEDKQVKNNEEIEPEQEANQNSIEQKNEGEDTQIKTELKSKEQNDKSETKSPVKNDEIEKWNNGNKPDNDIEDEVENNDEDNEDDEANDEIIEDETVNSNKKISENVNKKQKN